VLFPGCSVYSSAQPAASSDVLFLTSLLTLLLLTSDWPRYHHHLDILFDLPAPGYPICDTDSLLVGHHCSHCHFPTWRCRPPFPLTPPHSPAHSCPTPLLQTLLLLWTIWIAHLHLSFRVLPLKPQGRCLFPSFRGTVPRCLACLVPSLSTCHVPSATLCSCCGRLTCCNRVTR
jgi:hypothetical protein